MRKRVQSIAFFTIFILILVLAMAEARDIYIGLSTPLERVQFRCDQSLSVYLTCWCYNEYGRKCPIEPD